MKPESLATVLLCASSAAFAGDFCDPLPSSLRNTRVSYFDEASELQNLDEQLEAHLQRCLVPVTADNRKRICANGKLVAEQALSLVARIDEAGKRNAVLRNAKMRSYKTGVSLLDHMKQLVANKTCL